MSCHNYPALRAGKGIVSTTQRGLALTAIKFVSGLPGRAYHQGAKVMVKEDFEKKILEVAVILGFQASFKGRREPRDVELNSGDERITIYPFWDEKRLSVFGEYPRTKRGECANGIASVSITISEKKTAKQMAKEIERRFMPKYRAQLAEAIEQVESLNVSMMEQGGSGRGNHEDSAI